MLTLKQRRSVTRALIKAYYSYRDLSMLKIARVEGIQILIDRNDPLGGHAGGTRINIPGNCPRLYKEYVFWHELCHVIVERLKFYPRLIGHQGMLQQFDGDGGYWVWERLCEAFAALMILYRHVGVTVTNVEEFVFEDSSSIGYAEAARYAIKRIGEQCTKAIAEGRNLDLSDVWQMLEHQERFIYVTAHQQMLPTTFRDCHQTPWVTYVDERKDLLTNERHWDKQSWKFTHSKERAILAEIESLKASHAQLALFEEVMYVDCKQFAERLVQLDRMVQRFQKT